MSEEKAKQELNGTASPKKNEKVPNESTGKGEAKEDGKPKKGKKAKSKRRSVIEGNAYIKAAFNNTLISISETNGDIISASSAGASGFKGARKATPYAAQVAAENAIEKAKIYGLERVHVFVNGAGPGREQAIRGLIAGGVTIESITDTTTVPHNGCRKKKARRV